ncbi:hypothetical protein L804_01655 [Cryptococcus deuterogattii 2001/935-1]|nr:hypothetical protein L804_01655 [Cryptococcus deuterogattii 2001/935-1]
MKRDGSALLGCLLSKKLPMSARLLILLSNSINVTRRLNITASNPGMTFSLAVSEKKFDR